jgi:HK97 family phage prohead protease
MSTFSRSFPLEDITIQRGGDGRTVEAYAAVYNTPAEIRDGQGHYLEQIHPSAFSRAIDHARPQGSRQAWRIGVFYNHGKTLYGTPSELDSMPVGTTVDVKSDSKGLLTVTRYHKTPRADAILEAIREGAITSQSFSGETRQSTPEARRYQPARDGSLTLVTRNVLGLREYGPTPMPAYDIPMVVGVRSLAAQLSELTDEERAEIASMLSLATPLDEGQAERSDTAGDEELAPVAEDQPERHSGRLTPAQRARVGAILRGM